MTEGTVTGGAASLAVERRGRHGLWLLSLLVLATPFDYHDVVGILSVSDLLLLLLGLVFAADVLLGGMRVRLSREDLLFPLLLLGFTAATLFSRSWETSVRFLVTCGMSLSLCWLTLQYMGREGALPVLFRAAVLAGMLSSVLGYYQYYVYLTSGTGIWKTDVLFLPSARLFRLHGLYGDPNYLTFYLIVPVVLCFYVLFRRRDFPRRERRWAWLGLATVLPAYGLTLSRGGILTLAFGLGVLIAAEGRFRLRALLFVAVLAAGLTGTYLADYLVGLGRDSVHGRLTAQLASLEIWTEHPLTGLGPGIVPFNRFLHLTMGAHNGYVSVLATAGLAGFVPFALLLWTVFRNGLARVRALAEGRERVLYKAFLLAFACMCAEMLTLDAVFMKHFWIVAGVLAGFGGAHRLGDETGSPARPPLP